MLGFGFEAAQFAQKVKMIKKAILAKAMPQDAAVHYRVEAVDLHAHLWRITLSIRQAARRQVVSLPVWIPGSYMVREFSKHVQNLSASQAGQPVALQQLDKCTWQVANTRVADLQISYEVYAYDNSVRTAWLDAHRAFFNPTSLCLRVHGAQNQTHVLDLIAIKNIANYSIYTGARPLKVSKKGVGSYVFASYDELADTPFDMHAGWQGRFKVRGVEHVIAVYGAWPSFDGVRLLADTKKIVEAELQFWHGSQDKPPFERYVFMINAVDEGYGGLEHRNSTALICSRRDLPRSGALKPTDGYTTLLGLISHEYFHTWNVKRLKPKEFLSYDYAQENYTQMLWFFEGFTSYYDDVLLRRAGLIDNAQYLRLLSKAINQVQQTPGRHVQSVAQASMDAWVKYYRQDENTPNATVSYYTKGSLVALCFDLSLRQGVAGGKKTSLDEVMRLLWRNSRAGQTQPTARKPVQGGGITEKDFARALRELSGRSYEQEIAAWVHSKQDLPLAPLLQAQGVNITPEPATALPLAQRLGLRVSESTGSLIIKTILRGGLAEKAGLVAGDECLAVDDWRIHKLDDLLMLAGQAQHAAVITVSRDKRLLRIALALPASLPLEPSHSFMLRAAQDEALNVWLLG